MFENLERIGRAVNSNALSTRNGPEPYNRLVFPPGASLKVPTASPCDCDSGTHDCAAHGSS